MIQALAALLILAVCSVPAGAQTTQPTSRPATPEAGVSPAPTTQPSAAPQPATTTQPAATTQPSADSAPAGETLPPAPSGPPVVGSASSDPGITPEEIQAHVNFLAADDMEGRYSGTPAYERAAAYVAGEFARCGVLPLGDDGTYLQGFPVVTRVEAGSDHSITWRRDGERTELATERVSPVSFSSNGTIAGRLAVAGYGIHAPGDEWDDFAGLDLDGKVALVFHGAPPGKEAEFEPVADGRSKAGACRDHGARAVLLVNPATAEEEGDEGDSPPPWRAGAGRIDGGIVCLHVDRAAACDLLGVTLADLDAYQQALDGAGTATLTHATPQVTLQTEILRRQGQGHNVVGWLPPRGDNDEVVVYGAHLDHLGLGEEGGFDPADIGQIHNGADDNASGIAGLIEIAERQAADPEGFPRGIVYVAFCAEELGLLGASHFVREPPVAIDRVTAMINMDMIGRGDDGVLQVAGVGTGDYFAALLPEVNVTHELDLRTAASGYGSSDHDCFTRASVPVLALFTGLHGDYHRPGDDADKLEARGAARIAAFAAEIGSWLARTAVPPAYVQLEEPKAGRGRGYGPYLGTRPSFADHPDGLLIEGVTAGGPAAEAGLEAGDVIVWFDRVRVKNIYDYTRALRSRQPGETATIVVQRGTREVTVFPLLTKRDSR